MTGEVRRLVRQAVDQAVRDGLRPSRCHLCAWCGAPFIRTSRQKYCSLAHRKLAWYATPAGKAWKRDFERVRHQQNRARKTAA